MPVLKTFLVEDSPVIRENLAAALEEMVPLQVVGHAEDEPGALQWLQNPPAPCDIIILDLFLRQGSGLNVLRRLSDARQRQDGARKRPAPRCVVLTNYATDEMRRQCLQLGASRVFDKSGEIEDLIDYCLALADEAGPREGRLDA
ncbi:response regulator transcription factor [Ideonella azotifigens]|uniref:Response regulatory domain-containing protein n=1 Tax=Ideonella azotifigens TaxID=513160 RepID=A0ABN1JQ05_9BURK|nr:response regulator transcription factor [Ideonella azotifigens]MCD2340124.1 response regulator transcription factor [Ideonella azotifigens]